MKADKFTKVVLTIIAINLTLLTIRNLDLIPKSYANTNANNTIHTPNTNYGIVPLNEDGSIDVRVKSFSPNSVMDVNIEEVGGYNTFGELEVKIKGQPIYVEMN